MQTAEEVLQWAAEYKEAHAEEIDAQERAKRGWFFDLAPDEPEWINVAYVLVCILAASAVAALIGLSGWLFLGVAVVLSVVIMTTVGGVLARGLLGLVLRRL